MKKSEVSALTKDVAELLTSKGITEYDKNDNMQALEYLLQLSFQHNGYVIEKDEVIEVKDNIDSVIIGFIIFNFVLTFGAMAYYTM